MKATYKLGLLATLISLFAARAPAEQTRFEDLSRQVSTLYEQGRYAEAIPIAEQAVRIAEDSLGPDHADVAACLNNLAALYDSQGMYNKAEPIYQRALKITEKNFGPDHPEVATCLNNLGALYDSQGRHAEAEVLFQRALKIYERQFGPDNVDVAMSLNNLGAIYNSQARYDQSEPLFLRALKIYEKVLGPDDLDTTPTMNNLALLYTTMGRFSEAEPLLLRALEICEEALGPDHPEIAASLNSLAELYRVQARYREAGLLHKRALKICEKTLGPNHPRVAQSLNNLAETYHAQEEYTEAEPLFRRALTICEETLGPAHPYVAVTLGNLARVCCSQDRYAEAEALFKRSLMIREVAYGPDHLSVATGLNNLAGLHYFQGRYTEAEPLYQRALKIRERALGPDNPEVAVSLGNLAELYRAWGEKANVTPLAARACRIDRAHFASNARTLSEQDAQAFAGTLRASFGLYLSCQADVGWGEAAADSTKPADMVFSCKGEVTDGILKRQRALVEQADSTAMAILHSWISVKSRLANLTSVGAGDDFQTYGMRRDSLSALAKKLESDLSLRSAAFRREKDYENVTGGRITSLLPENSALIEYVRYDYSQIKPDSLIPHFLAVVARAGAEPHVVELGEAKEIDELIETYRNTMAGLAQPGRALDTEDQKNYRHLAAKLGSLVLEPLEPYISGSALLLIAPDGDLNLVSFSALMDTDSTYLIESHTAHYLSSGRDLVRLSYEDEPGSGLLALGDPDYDAPRSRRLAELPAPAVEPIGVAQAGVSMRRSPSAGLRGLEWERLAGSGQEVQRVAAAWREEMQEPLEVCVGGQASEECFKRDAPGRRVIHLSTHGFYRKPPVTEELPERLYGAEVRFVAENPLLRSGLVLAGANLHGEEGEGVGAEDGTLTALEVSGMDLRGTEMVVLSACETGLGDVAQGEGVYGLRRAFQVAGARTVVSALWPVDDATTAQMMGSLYERSGESLSEAMRRVQLEKLSELRKSGLPDHPFAWAAFIATGDWR